MKDWIRIVWLGSKSIDFLKGVGQNLGLERIDAADAGRGRRGCPALPRAQGLPPELLAGLRAPSGPLSDQYYQQALPAVGAEKREAKLRALLAKIRRSSISAARPTATGSQSS